jgi:hypothetical protein
MVAERTETLLIGSGSRRPTTTKPQRQRVAIKVKKKPA